MKHLKWTPQGEAEAWYGCFAVIFFHGPLGDETMIDGIRLQLLSYRINSLDMFMGQGMNYHTPFMQLIYSPSDNIDWKEIINACVPNIFPNYRDTLFAIACDIAYMDGSIAPSARERLIYLATALQLEPELAAMFTRTSVIRNKRNIKISPIT